MENLPIGAEIDGDQLWSQILNRPQGLYSGALFLDRDGVMVEAELSVDTRLADSTIRSGDQIFVPERPWLSRNTGVVATGISASVALIIALFIR